MFLSLGSYYKNWKLDQENMEVYVILSENIYFFPLFDVFYNPVWSKHN